MPSEALPIAVDFCGDVSGLGEVRAALRKLEHARFFIAGVLDERDKQLYPRDLLVARLPGKKQRKEGGGRPVGIMRRSLKYDKERGSHLVIDFVWVDKEFRRMGIGRKLLVAGLVDGRDKAVRLLVAGSEENYQAVGLYESLGFRWTCALKTDMQLDREQVAAAVGQMVELLEQAGEQQAEAAADAAVAGAAAADAVTWAEAAALVMAATREQADEATGVGPAVSVASEGAAAQGVEEPVEPAEPDEGAGEGVGEGGGEGEGAGGGGEGEGVAPRHERLAERTSVTRPEERTSCTGDEEPSRPAVGCECELPTVHEPAVLGAAVGVR